MDEGRSSLTGALWFFLAVALVALFISAAAQGELSRGHMILAFMILGLAVVGTPFTLRWGERETQKEKNKRQSFDTLLDNMSVEELIALKRRLSDVEDDEEAVVNYLGDDGELVSRS